MCVDIMYYVHYLKANIYHMYAYCCSKTKQISCIFFSYKIDSRMKRKEVLTDDLRLLDIFKSVKRYV